MIIEPKKLLFLCVVVIFLMTPLVSSGQTSWRGTVSTAWNNAANWTAGVPAATIDAVIGDASFTGPYQPTISANAAARDLTVGATGGPVLTVNKNLTVARNLTIQTGGTVTQRGVTITIRGNWTNGGTYTTTNNNARISFGGAAQSISGTVVTGFRRLSIGAGSTVTLQSNISVAGSLTVSGTLVPAETVTPFTVSGAGSLTVDATGILNVTAAAFTDNYPITGAVTLSAGSVVAYSATLSNQTIRSTLTYSTLRITGASTVKTLSGNLNALNATTAAAGRIEVFSGTLDLSTFTATRATTIAGGALVVANNATLRIGGTSNFPSNFSTVELRLASTIVYNGGSQTVAAQTYGNLQLTGSTGTAVKTMPATAFTVEGSLTSTQGAATAVTFTAAAAITVNGNISIGTGTTFNGAGFTHNIAGSWAVAGTFTGASSTIRMTGGGAVISGTGTQNFNNLTIAGNNITAAADAALSISGQLANVEPGSFTHAPGGTITMTGATGTITGPDLSFDNLIITGVITTASVIAVNGNLIVNGSFTSTAEVNMKGTGKTISGTGAIAFGTLGIVGTITSASSFSVSTSLEVSGSFSASAGTATFTGNSNLNGTASLFNVVLNGVALHLSSNAVMGVANSFTITSGTFDVTSFTPNTVLYNGTGAQTVPGISYHHLLLSNSGAKTAAGAITVNGDVNISAGATFNGSSFAHVILGNWNNAGVYNAGSGSVEFRGAANSALTGATTFNTLTINKTTASARMTLLANVSAGIVNMTSGNMQTGANTLTITNTRNGNGIILGNIRRQHGFALATAYAFESPENTITLTGINTLTSITVSVVSGPIADFPSGAGMNREYTISSTGLLNASLITIRLHYEDNELNGNAEANMGLWQNTGAAWSTVGKTANSTTTNYVERSGLVSMTGRWTLSDNANIVRWNGSVSSDWATAGNWTSTQGAPSLPPGPSDIVEIGTAAFTNQPTISSGVTVKSIVFGSVQPATLTLAAGGSLTTQGNLTGIWAANATHTINVNNQSLTVNGDLSLSGNVSGRAINLNVGNGAVNVTGSLTQSGGANITYTGAGALNIGGNYNFTSGAFTAGNSTVSYNGAASQTVAGVTYNHLTVQKSGGNASCEAPLTVSGNLSLTGGTLNLLAGATVNGNVTIAAGASLSGNNAAISVNGNWLNSGAFAAGSSTVTFTGTNSQTISASAFNNIIVDKLSGTATLTGNAAISGVLSVNNGTLDISSFTASRSSLGGSFSLAGNATLLVGGATNFPANFSTYTMSSTSTVHYNGAGVQTVAGNTYGHLIFSNGGGNAKILAASATVNGDLTINSNAQFNGDAFTLNLYGNWNNNGTFVPASGTITLNGTNKTITGNTTFNRVTVFGSYTVAGSNITYNGLLLIATGGSFSAGAGLATVNGDLTNNGSLISTGTTTFTGLSQQTIRFVNAVVSNSSGIINFNGNVSPVLNSTSSPSYATLNINNTAGVTASVGWNVFVAFNISSGATFNGGGSTHTVFGSFTNNGVVTSSGTMNFTPAVATTVRLAGAAFNSTGTVIFGGTGALAVEGAPTALNNVVISNAAGVTPSANWNIGANLQLTSTGVLNAGSFTYTVGGNIESYGTLNGGTSAFTMTSPAGLIIGSPGTTFYDFTVTGTITAESDFNVSRNFNNNGTSASFNASPGTLIMTGAGASVISGTPASYALAQLEVNKAPGAAVTLAKNLTAVTAVVVSGGILDLAGFTLTQDAGQLTINDNAVLIIRGTGSLPVFSLYDLDTLSTVEYAGTTQAVSAATPYGNLTISAAGAKTAGAVLKILNNFTLSNGTFVPGSFADTIGGNWNMTSGTFTSTGSTMVFAGGGRQQVYSTGAFQHCTVNKPAGLIDLGSDVTINGTLNFILGNIRTGNSTVVLPATGSITNAGQAAGWVFGQLRKQVATGSAVARTFEIGDSLRYTPANVVFASVSAAGSLQARTTSSDHPAISSSGLDAAKSINRYWTFDNTGISFSTVNATMNWVAADVDAGVTAANLKVAGYNGSAWSLPAVTAASATSITATGISSLAALAVGELATFANWTGALSTNWFTTGNWSGGALPTAAANVVIPTGLTNYPLIASGTALAKDLTIQSGATVTVNAALLRIGGSIINNGVFTATNGSLELNGANAQTIPAGALAGNTMLNLTVDNAAGVTLGGALNITGILKVTSGQLNSGGYLTLVSTATRTALIDGSGNGEVLGNLTMQRYISSGFGYKYVSSPFQAATVGEFADELNLGASFPLFYRYEQNQASSGWTAYTSAASPLTPLQGYAANLGASAAPVTADMTGVVNNHTISATLFNHNQPYTLGFNLAGNPYPSPVDWDAASGWTRTNIDNAIYFFNAGTGDQYTGTYSSYINGVSSDGIAGNIIPAMQGFFVHVSNGAFPVSATLAVNNAARVNNLTPVFHREYPLTAPLVRLTAGFAADGPGADPLVIYFDQAASKGFDKEMDALKMRNTNPLVPNLFARLGAAELSICAWPASPDSTDIIPLRLLTEKAGIITFQTVSMERIPPGFHIYLRDSVAGITQELRKGATYRLQLAAGEYKDRFFLVFRQPGDTPATPADAATFRAYWANGQLFGYFDHVQDQRCGVTVTNMQGQVLLRRELQGNGRHSLGSGYVKGIYIVTFQAKQTLVSKKVLIY